MAEIYKSKYTGEQIELLLNKAEDIQTVTAFPDPQDGDYLGAIEIDNRPYLIPKGTVVKANDGGVEGAYILTITIEGQKYVMPAYVSPNPAESGTVELNKLAIGSTIYTIPKGTVVKANDGGVEGAYLQTLTVNGQKYVMPPYVSPNPAVEATQTLNKMAINDTIYQLPQGGGANVEANPSGDATATLNKIGINNVVYGLPAGGGASGGGYDLIIGGYYSVQLLRVYYADGTTSATSPTFNAGTTLHNVTAFEVNMRTTGTLMVDRGLKIYYKYNPYETMVRPGLDATAIYADGTYDYAMCLLISPCTIELSSN